MNSTLVNNKPVIGVLGGMGPRATVMFLQELVNQYRGRRDSDVPRLIVDFQTQIPSRSRHVLFGEKSPVGDLRIASQGLIALGADFVAIPCNSACALLPDDFFESGVNLNIVEITANHVRQRVGSNRFARVLVLAAPATTRLNAYGIRLQQHNFEVLYPDASEQLELECTIDHIKRFGKSEETLRRVQEIVSAVEGRSTVDAVLLACTELEELPYGHIKSSIPIISSSRSLVEHCFAITGS